VGASNHCAHGEGTSTEITIDWHPFEYSTVESYDKGRKLFIETDRFESLPAGGTRLHVLVKLNIPLPRFVRRIMGRRIMLDTYHYDQTLRDTAKLAGEEYRTAVGAQ
jgi:hypothetical protein